jgi:aminoglycoside 6'-N-acetyltransferase I
LPAPLQPLEIHIRSITEHDAAVWQQLRCELWPDGADEHAREIADFFAGKLFEPVAVLVAETPAREIVGFAELSIRGDIPGLEGKRVGYVEGLYVRPDVRHRGIAKRLLEAARAWAGQQQCAAFASDRAGRIVVDRRFDS